MRAASLIVVAMLTFASAPAAARIVEPALQRSAPSAAETGDLFAASSSKKRPPPRKKKRPAPAPDPRRPARAKAVNPAMVGLAASGASATGALIGASAVGLSTLALFGVFGAPSLPVIVTVSVIGITMGVATPFMAAIGGGAAVLLMDPRTKPEEWSSLLQCAASGYCAGLNLVAGTLLGEACGGAPGGRPGDGPLPGPEQAAEWTAAAAVAGLVGGTVLGGLIGWSVAPVPDDPLVPITVGALGGAVLGAGVSAGVSAAIATAIKR